MGAKKTATIARPTALEWGRRQVRLYVPFLREYVSRRIQYALVRLEPPWVQHRREIARLHQLHASGLGSVMDLRTEMYRRFGEEAHALRALNDLWQQYDLLERQFLNLPICVGEMR